MTKLITRKLQSHFAAAPPWIWVRATPLSFFSTLPLHPPQTPFAAFAKSKFNLSSADISRILKHSPSLKTLKTLQNVERVVHILTEHGCTRHQISQMMTKQPQLMTFNAEKVLEPKIQLLKDYGVQGQILAKVLNLLPRMFTANLERCLLPNIRLLKTVFKSQESLVTAISKSPSILVFNHEEILKPSVAFWEGCGLSGDELSNFLLRSPLLMTFSSLTPAHLDLIRKIGIPQGHKMYKYIMKFIASSKIQTLEAKIQNLQRCGLSPEETLMLIRVYPSTLGFSEENIREKMDFIVNQMELPANIVVKKPHLLGMSLEKIIKPKYMVVQKIKSMKGVENLELKSLPTILMMPEPRFVQNIIKKHPESSTLYAIYQDAIANALASKRIASEGSIFWRSGVVSEVQEH